jgi:uncharacterized repeat protein (TIGR01451 family)
MSVTMPNSVALEPDGEVGLYTCGPTVYSFSIILACFLTGLGIGSAVGAGQTITYTILVANTASTSQGSTTLSDVIPSNLSFVTDLDQDLEQLIRRRLGERKRLIDHPELKPAPDRFRRADADQLSGKTRLPQRQPVWRTSCRRESWRYLHARQSSRRWLRG